MSHEAFEGSRELADSPVLSGLTLLGLWNNQITDAGSQALLGSPHLGRLREIDLRLNLLSDTQEALWRRRLGRKNVRL